MMDNLYATAYTVGEWNGQEELAASNFNRIVNALAERINNSDDLHDEVHYAWDDWGSEESLLTITDKQIRDYVDRKVN